MAIDFKALGRKAAEQGKADMTKVQTGEGGGEYTPPAAGVCHLRFIGYIEVGQHASNFKGQEKKAYLAYALFELSGPKHPPQDFDGKLVPHVVKVKLNVSRHEKATMVKLFNILNWKQTTNNFPDLIGNEYLGTIRHREYTKKDGSKGVSPELTTADGVLTIRPHIYDDPADGETRTVKVAPAISQLRCFLWDFPCEQTWESIFIDGEYPAREADEKTGRKALPAKSKNAWQAQIKSSLTFKGSAVHAFLGGGDTIDIPDAEHPDGEGQEASEEVQATTPATTPAEAAVPTGKAADDALAGVV